MGSRAEGDGSVTGPVALATATWPDVAAAAAGSILVVPVGSVEQHGPHLPFDTDTRIASEVAIRAAARSRVSVVVAPALAYGSSGEHSGFAGTLSIGTEVLSTVLVELGRSADEFAALMFVNGHGGNARAVNRAVALLRAESRDAHAWSWSVAGGDAHAGRTETSLMCAIDASVVRFDRAASGRTEPLADLLDDLRARGVRAVAPNGVLGDPRGASCDEGEMMLEGLVAALVDRLAEVADATGRPGGQPV